MSFSPLIAAVVGLPFLLMACSTTMPQSQPPDSVDVSPSNRYHVGQDSAPIRAISQDEVSDAIPQADPILTFGNMSPYVINGVTYTVLEDYRDYREQGTASWYGAKFSGHKTSNGELYDLYQPSAAHKTLPIPSYARVTNLDNGKSIVVRVNDRGPFHSDRIIDLSYAAAVKLGYMEQGTAQVEVEVIGLVGVEDRRDPVYGDYRFLQLGAFGSESSAQTLVKTLKPLLTARVFVSAVESDGTVLYRVRVGPVDDKNHLLAVQQQLRDNGYDSGQPLP
ncbi:MAG: septal ring lytic transglycosylase RlpA family protein [Halioglobus sp.]|nr:septal ring lytic transglycosylase RlpA family protein [Halioglobus sp.]